MDSYEIIDRLEKEGFSTFRLKPQMIDKICFILKEDQEGLNGIDLLKWRHEEEAKLTNKRRKLLQREKELNEKLEEYNNLANIDDRTEECIKYAQNKIDEYLKDAKEFMNGLNECETPDGRDMMKRAQLFIDVVDKDDRNKPTFINGLSFILSSKGCNDCGSMLTKIDRDRKLPEFKVSGEKGNIHLRQGD